MRARPMRLWRRCWSGSKNCSDPRARLAWPASVRQRVSVQAWRPAVCRTAHTHRPGCAAVPGYVPARRPESFEPDTSTAAVAALLRVPAPSRSGWRCHIGGRGSGQWRAAACTCNGRVGRNSGRIAPNKKTARCVPVFAVLRAKMASGTHLVCAGSYQCDSCYVTQPPSPSSATHAAVARCHYWPALVL